MFTSKRRQLMKKFWLLVCTCFLGITLAACGQKSYAGVQLDSDKYAQLTEGKQNIAHLLDTLKHFNYRKAGTAEKIYEAADDIMTENTKGLSTADKEKLDIQVDNSAHGVKGIVQDAMKNKYMIDGSVASQFHTNFDVIIDSTAKAVTRSDVQAQKVAAELNKQLKVEAKLNSLGSQHE